VGTGRLTPIGAWARAAESHLPVRPRSRPCAAARAEAAAFATEGDDLLLATVRAAHAQGTVFQTATLQESIEFPRYILRQGRVACGHVVYQRGVVLLDELIEKGLFGSVALVTVGALARDGHAGWPVGCVHRQRSGQARGGAATGPPRILCITDAHILRTLSHLNDE
jgi:hypothetical protein